LQQTLSAWGDLQTLILKFFHSYYIKHKPGTLLVIKLRLVTPKTPAMHKIIVAINQLKVTIMELSAKVDNLAKSPSQQLTAKYLDNVAAGKILHVGPRTLAKMRADGTIPFTKIRRRILYEASDLNLYLEKNNNRRKSLFS